MALIEVQALVDAALVVVAVVVPALHGQGLQEVPSRERSSWVRWTSDRHSRNRHACTGPDASGAARGPHDLACPDADVRAHEAGDDEAASCRQHHATAPHCGAMAPALSSHRLACPSARSAPMDNTAAHGSGPGPGHGTRPERRPGSRPLPGGAALAARVGGDGDLPARSQRRGHDTVARVVDGPAAAQPRGAAGAPAPVGSRPTRPSAKAAFPRGVDARPAYPSLPATCAWACPSKRALPAAVV